MSDNLLPNGSSFFCTDEFGILQTKELRKEEKENGKEV